MKTIFTIRNITTNETRKVVGRNIDEVCNKLHWQKKNIVLVDRKNMPDDFDGE